MKVCDLIAQLQKLPQDKSVLCQVVPQDPPGAWNMHFDVQDIPRSTEFVQLRVWHPDLKTMPAWPQARGAGWLPIESAPRVFSPPLSPIVDHAPDILGLWGQSFYSVCHWGGPNRPYWIGGDQKKVPFQPTRWMPLPPPPEFVQA